MTRLADLWHFGLLFKACGKTYFAQIPHIFGNFCKGFKIFHFSSQIVFGHLLQTFGDFLLVTLADNNAQLGTTNRYDNQWPIL